MSENRKKPSAVVPESDREEWENKNILDVADSLIEQGIRLYIAMGLSDEDIEEIIKITIQSKLERAKVFLEWRKNP